MEISAGLSGITLPFFMNTFSWMTAFLVFVFYIVIDSLWVLYTRYVQDNRAFAAATVGAAMYGLFGFGTLAIVESAWNIVPMIIGSWLGTYLTIKLIKK